MTSDDIIVRANPKRRRFSRKVHRAYTRTRHNLWLRYAVPAALKVFVEASMDASRRMWDGVAQALERSNVLVEGRPRWGGTAHYFDVVARR